MLVQELQRPMEFNHPPLLVRGVCARDIVFKIAFKNRRKVRRSLYGIGMPIEIHFRKPDNATITVETVKKESLPFFSTEKTKFLSCNQIDDF